MPSPYQGFSLVVIEGLLTAVGGYDFYHRDQNKLMSLIDGIWVEHYPPMPTSRHYTTAMVSTRTLIVAGGSIKNNIRISTVEIMDISSKEWSVVENMPNAASSCTSTVCGEDIFIMGGFDSHAKPSNKAFTSSVSRLREGTKNIGMNELARDTLGPVWRELLDVPALFCGCTTLNKHLIAVGGMKNFKRPTGDIYRYDETNNSWDVIGCIPTPRYCSVVATLSEDELVVVGGLDGQIPSDCVNLLEGAKF